MSNAPTVVEKFQAWYRHEAARSPAGVPSRGKIAAALVVLERLQQTPDFEFAAHVTEGRGQIAGLTPASLRRILERFGEEREYLREGGRTNRGNHAFVADMLESLRASPLPSMEGEQRRQTIDQLQRLLVEGPVKDFFNRQRIEFEYDANLPVRTAIGDILLYARASGRDGYVAQHLVGAKLEIRFLDQPGMTVSNFPASAGDTQAQRAGDFEIADTVFHVTTAPSEANMARCRDDLGNGLASVLLVPEDKLVLARELTRQAELDKRVAVESIESFVGQNLSELGRFSHAGRHEQLKQLLVVYNRRVEEVESDRSLMIEPPAQLRD